MTDKEKESSKEGSKEELTAKKELIAGQSKPVANSKVKCQVKEGTFHAIQDGKRVAIEKGEKVVITAEQYESFSDVLVKV